MTDIQKAYDSEKPKWIDTEVELADLEIYLDDLRESGVTNMFGAGSYLEKDFDLSKERAGEMLLFWMKFFGARSEGKITHSWENDDWKEDFEASVT